MYIFWLSVVQPWLGWEFIIPSHIPPNRSFLQFKNVLSRSLFIWHCVWPGLRRKKTVWKRLIVVWVGAENWFFLICMPFLLLAPVNSGSLCDLPGSRLAPCECLWLILKASVTTTLHTTTFNLSEWIYLHYVLSNVNPVLFDKGKSSFCLFVTFSPLMVFWSHHRAL